MKLFLYLFIATPLFLHSQNSFEIVIPKDRYSIDETNRIIVCTINTENYIDTTPVDNVYLQ